MWAADLYGEAGYARALRANTAAYIAGVLLFGPVPGTLADYFGSYVPAYALFALVLAAAMILIRRIYAHQGIDCRPAAGKG